jgi:hypothetical protein
MAYGLVGEPYVLRVAVGLGVDGNRSQSHLVAGADHAHRDLAPIGDQDLLERRGIRAGCCRACAADWNPACSREGAARR